MSGEPPPPLPAEPPPPRAAGEPAENPWPAVAGQKAGRAAAFAGWMICATVFAVACCGGGAFLAVGKLDRSVRVREAKLADREAADAKRDEAADLLEAIAARLRADPGDLPELLPEAPPRDPWGNAVRYARTRPGRAALSSAGPDGRFDTPDDVVLPITRP